MSVFTQCTQLLTGPTTKQAPAAAPPPDSAATPASTAHANLRRELSGVQRQILARTGQRISIAAARTAVVARTASRLPWASSDPASSDPEHTCVCEVPDSSERASLAPLPLQRLHGLPQAFLRILQANGVCVVPDGTERAFLAPLPLQHLYGVPAPTLRLLQASGLITIGELQRVPKAALQAAFGPSEGLLLWRSARGLDPLPRNAQAGFRSRLIPHATANSRKLSAFGNFSASASHHRIRGLFAQIVRRLAF